MALSIPDQTGRIAVITGANSGLGLRTAEALARAGGTVVLACRNPERAAAALQTVARVATGAEPVTVALDLADLDSVGEAACTIAGMVDHIDILVNNAGIMAPPLGRTAQGFEMQFGVNHLGHFALTGHLLSTLLAAPSPRVVTVSSTAHRVGKMHWDDLNAERRYHRWVRYGQSKLANLLFTAELADQSQLNGTALVSVAAHPGYAATGLTTNGPGEHGTRRLTSWAVGLGDRVFAQSDEQGARPQIHAATAPAVANNEYYGPDGFMEQHGKGAMRVARTGRARDTEDARRLWAVSEELTRVSYDWEPTSD